MSFRAAKCSVVGARALLALVCVSSVSYGAGWETEVNAVEVVLCRECSFQIDPTSQGGLSVINRAGAEVRYRWVVPCPVSSMLSSMTDGLGAVGMSSEQCLPFEDRNDTSSHLWQSATSINISGTTTDLRLDILGSEAAEVVLESPLGNWGLDVRDPVITRVGDQRVKRWSVTIDHALFGRWNDLVDITPVHIGETPGCWVPCSQESSDGR